METNSNKRNLNNNWKLMETCNNMTLKQQKNRIVGVRFTARTLSNLQELAEKKETSMASLIRNYTIEGLAAENINHNKAQAAE